MGRAAFASDFLRHNFGIGKHKAMHQHDSTFTRHRLRNDAPRAPIGAGHKRHFAFELKVHHLPP